MADTSAFDARPAPEPGRRPGTWQTKAQGVSRATEKPRPEAGRPWPRSRETSIAAVDVRFALLRPIPAHAMGGPTYRSGSPMPLHKGSAWRPTGSGPAIGLGGDVPGRRRGRGPRRAFADNPVVWGRSSHWILEAGVDRAELILPRPAGLVAHARGTSLPVGIQGALSRTLSLRHPPSCIRGLRCVDRPRGRGSLSPASHRQPPGGRPS